MTPGGSATPSIHKHIILYFALFDKPALTGRWNYHSRRPPDVPQYLRHIRRFLLSVRITVHSVEAEYDQAIQIKEVIAMKRTMPLFYTAYAAEEAGMDPELEQAIREDANFWRKGTALYRSVPLRDLTGQGEGTLPYLLCRGKKAVAAFLVGDADDLPDAPDLPVLCFHRGEPKRAVAVLKRILLTDVSYRWRYTPEPVPDACFPELERHRLILREAEGFVPGGYGAEMGLTLGYRGKDSSPAPRIFWSVEARKAIEELLEDRGSPQLPRPRAFLSWKERLAAAQAGLIAPDRSQEEIRTLADLPLEIYLAACPEKLEDLRRGLHLPEDATYRQAACQINELLCSSSDADRELGRQDMLALAQPFWLADQKGETL